MIVDLVDRQVINFLDASSVEHFYHSFNGNERFNDEKKGNEKKGTGKSMLVTYHTLQGKKKLIDGYIRDIIATPSLEGMQ